MNMKRELAEELLRVKGDKELLHAADVVDAAVSRAEEFPYIHADYIEHGLHDPEKAIAFARYSWARGLIADFRVQYPDPSAPKMVREFVSLSSDRTSGGGYRSTKEVQSSVELLNVLLEDEIKTLERTIRNADGLLVGARVRKRYQSAGEKLLAIFGSGGGGFASPPPPPRPRRPKGGRDAGSHRSPPPR